MLPRISEADQDSLDATCRKLHRFLQPPTNSPDEAIFGAGRGLSADSVQIPFLVRNAREQGAVQIVGRGVNRWGNVHIDDLVDLYVRALADAPAGAFYFAVSGEASFADIGGALAARLALPLVSIPLDEATTRWGEARARYTFGSNCAVRATRAPRELGWLPRHADVTAWIRDEMPL
jgi:nucleoside-diphosphate-sugar epimerase